MAATRHKILLVEDQRAHVKLIERAFEFAGASLQLNTPDVVIADLELPDGRGTDLIPAQQSDAPYPVIVLTSHGDENIAVEVMKAGALDYVVKSASVMRDMPRITTAALREWKHLLERRRAEEART